jgi:hypothetical protein
MLPSSSGSSFDLGFPEKRKVFQHLCRGLRLVGRIPDRISYSIFLQIAGLNLCSRFVQGDAASPTKMAKNQMLRPHYASPMLMLNLDCKPFRCDALKLRANFSPVAHLPMRRPRDCFWDATGWLASIGEQIKRPKTFPCLSYSPCGVVVAQQAWPHMVDLQPFRSPSRKVYLINISVGWLTGGLYIAILVDVCGYSESD